MTTGQKSVAMPGNQNEERLSSLKQMVREKLAEVQAKKVAGEYLKPSKKRDR